METEVNCWLSVVSTITQKTNHVLKTMFTLILFKITKPDPENNRLSNLKFFACLELLPLLYTHTYYRIHAFPKQNNLELNLPF